MRVLRVGDQVAVDIAGPIVDERIDEHGRSLLVEYEDNEGRLRRRWLSEDELYHTEADVEAAHVAASVAALN
ncbi:hypothetical protein ACXIUS_28940 [Bosea thiooxidans]